LLTDKKALTPSQIILAQFRAASFLFHPKSVAVLFNQDFPENKFLPKSSAQVDLLVGPPKDRASAEPKRKRAHPIRVRLSHEEKATVQRNAQQAGCSVNAYVKASALRRLPIGSELRQTLLSLNKELTAQGNNLNQIARHLNGGAISAGQALSALNSIRAPWERALMAVRVALVRRTPGP
jgi:uncharacterized protein (DUF1778 family)